MEVARTLDREQEASQPSAQSLTMGLLKDSPVLVSATELSETWRVTEMGALGQVRVRESALRTPTSTHFLCSEGLASHVRGRAPASEKNIATTTNESRPEKPKPPPPKPGCCKPLARVNAAKEAELGWATPTSSPIGRPASHWR